MVAPALLKVVEPFVHAIRRMEDIATVGDDDARQRNRNEVAVHLVIHGPPVAPPLAVAPARAAVKPLHENALRVMRSPMAFEDERRDRIHMLHTDALMAGEARVLDAREHIVQALALNTN